MPITDDVSRRDLLVTSLLTSLPFSLSIAAAAFLAGMLAAVSVSSTSSWAQSSPEQEGVNKPITKKPSRKIAASPLF